MAYLLCQAHSFTPALVNGLWEAQACNTSLAGAHPVRSPCFKPALNVNGLLEADTSSPVLVVHVLEGWGVMLINKHHL